MTNEEIKRIETLIAACGKNFLSADEVCALYGFSKNELADLVRTRQIQPVRSADGRIRFPKYSIDFFLKGNNYIDPKEIPSIAEQIRNAK